MVDRNRPLSEEETRELLELRDNFDELEACAKELDDIVVRAGTTAAKLRMVLSRARTARAIR